MPCSDQLFHDRKHTISYIQDPATREMTKKMNDKINSLTAMLCSLCQQVEQINAPLITGNIDLQNWWEAHKAHDKAHDKPKLD